MKLLSIDTETTGLTEETQLVEFACVPSDSATGEIREDLAFHCLIKCDSFKSLSGVLSEWVKEHNKGLIIQAHEEGVSREVFKSQLETYFNSPELLEYLGEDDVSILGKSVCSLDYPLLEKYLGWNFMRTYFTRRILDIQHVAIHYCDKGLLPKNTVSSKKLVNHFNIADDVNHTAFSDCVDMIKIYLELLKL